MKNDGTLRMNHERIHHVQVYINIALFLVNAINVGVHGTLYYRHRVDSMALLQAASPHLPHGWPLVLFSGPNWKFIWFRHRFIRRASVSVFVSMVASAGAIYLRGRRRQRVVPKPLKFILNKLQCSRRCTIKIAPEYRNGCAYLHHCRANETVFLVFFSVRLSLSLAINFGCLWYTRTRMRYESKKEKREQNVRFSLVCQCVILVLST